MISYWVGEGNQLTGTKPKFREIQLNLHKLTGLCYVTEEESEDAAQLSGTLQNGFQSEFGFRLDDGVVNGTGGGQPLGILNAGSLVTESKEPGQKAATILAENVVNMYSRMFASSIGNAVWLVNQDTLPQLFTMSLSVGTGGAPIFMPAGGLSQSPYNTLLGRPVLPIEQCQTLGTKGDIYFADVTSGYVVAEKGGLKTDMSIHLRFDYAESVWRFMLRADGQPIRATALTPFKGSNTQSHFVCLETRS
jgi:HK97 family phage major capsid protein